ncbi:MAG TPA: YCF48-related protein [Ignavibacteriaceae bacterium]|nr:YCF48-related protein [Ignavibacteriaceae bacterium]
MAKLLFFVLVLLLSSISFSQWTSLNPYPTSSSTFIGSSPSVNKYVTCTDYTGEAVMTTDGGTTWKVTFMGWDGVFRRMFFLNDNIGWAAGAMSESFYKTTDGGYTWFHLPNGPDTTKYDVFFINENIGWTVGYYGSINKTTDGGNSWTSQSNSLLTTKTLYGVYATDNNNVFVSGSADVLLRSTDGGDSFTNSPLVFSTATDYKCVSFFNNNIGFAAGSKGRVAKTTDGGATWTPSMNLGNTTQVWKVTCNNNGVVIASADKGTVYRSTDWGSTWTTTGSFPSTTITFYSVQFASENVVYLSGSSGYFYKSTDAGATWATMGRRTEALTSLKGFSMSPDNVTGYAVGNTGKIFKTTDGGLSYFQQTSPFTATIYEVVTVDPQTVFASCQDGVVLRTTNGGATWDSSIVAPNTIDFVGLDFISPTVGYVAGTNGNVFSTKDGGISWTNVSIPGSTTLLWDVDFVDTTTGFICGTGGKVFCTKNGGETWTEQLSAGGLGMYGISFIDRMNGVVAGSSGYGPYYTTDGGTTWNPSSPLDPSQTVWSVKMVKTSFGTVAFAACASGYIFMSYDTCKTWTPVTRLTISTFEDVSVTDAGHAWFAAGSGVVIGYDNPLYYPVELMSLTSSVNGRDVTIRWSTATELNNSGFEVERKSENSNWQRIGFVNGKINSTEINNYKFTDKNLALGKYNYRIKQLDVNGTYEYFNVENTIEISVPNVFSLEQNYPNPFNPSTSISFNVPVKSEITLKIYNILGKEVANLLNEVKDARYYTINYNASDLASGIYFYELRAGNKTITKKMMLMK